MQDAISYISVIIKGSNRTHYSVWVTLAEQEDSKINRYREDKQKTPVSYKKKITYNKNTLVIQTLQRPNNFKSN